MLLQIERVPTEPTSVLIAGHSHLAALRHVYRALSRAQGDKTLPFTVEFLFLRDRKRDDLKKKQGPTALPLDAIRDAVTRSAAKYVVSCVGGNAHTSLGLINHPQPFDFVLPEEPDLPLIPGAEILPSEAVRAALRSKMQKPDAALAELRAATSRPMIHLESPPPIPSEEHIRKYPSVFEARIAARGVTPITLRYKLWRLHSSIVRESCKQLGVSFMTVPPSAQNSDGTLVEQAWNDDPTHGNRWYGIRVMHRLAKFIANLESSPAAEPATP
jgi:hypothetical protein